MPEPDRPDPGTPDRDRRTGSAAAANRMRDQGRFVDLAVQRAIERGEFDDLPGAGKPIEGLGGEHDPDWWLKKLVEREKITVLPAALALRSEDAALDATLDALAGEAEVRRHLDDFNARVRRARMQLEGGPPVVTPLRDVDAEVELWRERRSARASRLRDAAGEADATPPPRRRRWWPGRRDS